MIDLGGESATAVSTLWYPSKKAEKGLGGLRTMGGSKEDSWLATIRREPGFQACREGAGSHQSWGQKVAVDECLVPSIWPREKGFRVLTIDTGQKPCAGQAF